MDNIKRRNNVDTTNNNDKQINYLSLCSGIEGAGIALKGVYRGLRPIAFVEREMPVICNLVEKMEKKWIPPTPIHTDCTTFPYRKFRGLVDICSFGAPCQPFSLAGSRRGVDDERAIFPQILEGLEQCQPKIIMAENVEGLISTKTPEGGSLLQLWLTELERIGYCCSWGLYTATEVGCSHIRKRVFIVGVRKELVDSKSWSDRQYQAQRKGRDTFISTSEGDTNNLSNTEDIGCRGGSDRNDGGRRSIQEQASQEQSNIRSEVEGCSRDIPNTTSEGLQGYPRGQSGEGHDSTKESISNVSNTNSGRRNEDRESTELRTEGIEQSSIDSGRNNQAQDEQEFSDSYYKRLERCLSERESEEKAKELTPRLGWRNYPARPNQEQFGWEEPRVIEAKRKVGGADDGVSSRVDSLRMLGNAIVPGQALKAFVFLYKEIMDLD